MKQTYDKGMIITWLESNNKSICVSLNGNWTNLPKYQTIVPTNAVAAAAVMKVWIVWIIIETKVSYAIIIFVCNFHFDACHIINNSTTNRTTIYLAFRFNNECEIKLHFSCSLYSTNCELDS